MSVQKLVVVEDATIRMMMNDQRYTSLMPVLKQVKKQVDSVKPGKKNCNRCKKEKRALVSQAMNQARNAVRSLRGPKLKQVKGLLNAQQIRVVARNQSGRSVKWTL